MSPKEPKLEVDADLIRKLAQLLAETGLGEIEYAAGNLRVRVARPAAAATVVAASTAPAASASAAPAPSEAQAPANAVTAPMVGTVYLSPEPGAAPFVRVGDKVKEGQTLLIIEAMKVMNPIRASRGGAVTQVLVTDGQPVEYGEPLVILE